MQLTTRLQKPKRRTKRPTPRQSAPRQSAPRPSAPLTPEAAETRDARRGGGPEDRALYSCVCGFAFSAKVSTSVDCPHCGTEQAW
jgi:hypothetical protein